MTAVQSPHRLPWSLLKRTPLHRTLTGSVIEDAKVIGEQSVHFYNTEEHGDWLRPLLPAFPKGAVRRDYRYGVSLVTRLERFRTGRVPPEAIVGWTNAPDEARVHQDFWEQTAFVDFLHEHIGQFVDGGGDEALRARAQAYHSGWMAIGDERALAPLNRTPDPDDIFGMILVRDGHVVRGSYQPMPMHRLFTHIGAFQLPAGLHGFVLQALERCILALQ
jgi:hypothetical protein